MGLNKYNKPCVIATMLINKSQIDFAIDPLKLVLRFYHYVSVFLAKKTKTQRRDNPRTTRVCKPMYVQCMCNVY